VVLITENPDPPVVVFTVTVAVSSQHGGDRPFAAGTALTVDFTGATDAADWVGLDLYRGGRAPWRHRVTIYCWSRRDGTKRLLHVAHRPGTL
jgi:hypothetical protein